MTSSRFTRRDFSVRLATLLSALGVARTAFGSAGSSQAARTSGSEEVSHTAEAIHQEVLLKASPKRVYEALTDASHFDKVVQLSAAMKSGMIKGGPPTELSPEVGSAFTLFGGFIVGIQVELVPNQRIVEAWRAAPDWNPGVYSIARFELTEQDSGTKLVLDHTGFPEGDGQTLAQGWKENYWEPLAKSLA
ncbi:MAG: SRPBCC domain-containing protein [Candidatus Acidiferrales bacterium]